MKMGKMARYLVAGVLGLGLGVAAKAQESASERVLNGNIPVAATEASPTRLPVSMNDALPGEQDWANKVVADPAPGATGVLPDSAAGNALQAGTPTEEAYVTPAERGGLIRRIIQFPKQPYPSARLFGKGQFEVEYLTQLFRSPPWGSSRKTYFLAQILRFGVMLNSPDPDRRLRGNFEFLAEFDCLPVTFGTGSIVIGGSGLLRYNRSYLNRRGIMYLQAGFGGAYSDAYLNPQSPTNSPFNFITQVGLGNHLFLRRNLAFTSETCYYHISFPGQAPGNSGFHIFGGGVGLTWFFGPRG